jgi:hypothetical protein
MTASSPVSAADRVPHDLPIAGEWHAAAGVMNVVNPATEGTP